MGDTDSLKCKIDNYHYEYYCLKDPDYIMKIMSTYSVLIEYPNQKGSTQSFTDISGDSKMEKFKYMITF